MAATIQTTPTIDAVPTAGYGNDRILSKRLTRLLLRLRQSRKGLATAAGMLARTAPHTAERLMEMRHARHEADAMLADIALTHSLRWRTKRDVAGVLHRLWLKAIGRTGPAAVLDECDRGETALLASIHALGAADIPAQLRNRLAALGMEVKADREWMRQIRKTLDAPLTVDAEEPESATVGLPMPDFRAPASTGQTLNSDKYRGKLPLVIFFVPDSGSRRSHKRIAEFNRRLSQFGRRRTQVLGIVPETATQIRRQAERRGYNLPLLADPDESIHRAFGIDDIENPAWTTFVVDREGIVARTYRPSTRPGHAQQVLAAVTALRESGAPMEPQVAS